MVRFQMNYEFLKFLDSRASSPGAPRMTDEVSFQNRKYFSLPVYFDSNTDSYNA